MKHLIRTLIVIGVFFLTSESAAQVELNDGSIAISLGVGGNTYVGDLNPDRQTRQFNVQAAFTRYVDERTFFKLGINYGDIQAEYEPGDPLDLGSNPDINSFFSAHILSADLSFNWDVIQWSFIHVYGGTGIGFMDYQIQDNEGRNLNDRPVTRLENENYSTRMVYFPVNMGFVLFPRRQINIVYEQSWNLTNSDYLDNIGYLGDDSSDWILRRMFMVRYFF